ncbi:MAG: AAA family ATPase [Janthinobacterium lividum]
MIRIDRVRIREFRGIRDHTLELRGESFAACGPNGTGKSGIVDAVEFALTGKISRLTGQGTSGLSVKAHGPHVDSIERPEMASVTMDVLISSLGGKRATIHRTVKSPAKPTITPDDIDVVAAFDHMQRHPEFVLSRRELMRYVLSEAGQRSKEVQSLLRLDDIERMRAVLQKISNSCVRELPILRRNHTAAETQLLAALAIPDLGKTALLAAVNTQRNVLGLSELADLEGTTSLKDGVLAGHVTATIGKVPKLQAIADLTTLGTTLDALRSLDFGHRCNLAATATMDFAGHGGGIGDAVARETLLQSALTLFDEETCPVCDTDFEPSVFRQRVNGKLTHLAAITAERTALEATLGSLMDAIHAAGSALTTVIDHAALLSPPVATPGMVEFRASLRASYSQLKRLLPLADTAAVLPTVSRVPWQVDAEATAVAALVTEIPEPTQQEAARDFLVLAQERLAHFRKAKAETVAGERKADLAAKALLTFGVVTTKALEAIYQRVENTFSGHYRTINSDDESAFTATLVPSVGKLSFDVDFYGRGHFPPGAYHSEGHQDGMGLCLYLALMGHLQSANFTLAVLDDVLMSVDSGHRREVCKLLRGAFPDTQFIFTTHDEVWLRHMKSEGLIKARNAAHFRTWSVDLGPIEWDRHDVWSELDAHLGRNDVRATAALLRHYLEHFSKEACDRLRADVEFKGDGQFTLGDLLPRATSAMSKLLKQGKAAANSWGKREVVEAIGVKEAAFSTMVRRTEVENWQINAAVHYNAWADFQQSDFGPVVASFRELTTAFSCLSCHAMFYVSPEREVKESLRCVCGSLNLNLLAKKV